MRSPVPCARGSGLYVVGPTFIRSGVRGPAHAGPLFLRYISGGACYEFRPMMHTLSLATVFLAGLYFVALAGVAFLAPSRAADFLGGFAQTAGRHYLELGLRVITGVALVVQGPRMPFSMAFSVFGWMLVLTTAGLAMLPWRWHRMFAERAIPRITRHLLLVGCVSLVLGAVILTALYAAELPGSK